MDVGTEEIRCGSPKSPGRLHDAFQAECSPIEDSNGIDGSHVSNIFPTIAPPPKTIHLDPPIHTDPATT